MAAFGNMSINNTDIGGFHETRGNNSGMSVGKRREIIMASFSLLISILGIIGNSLIFWYLSFKIKRTKYTVYIINLAVADLIYLIPFFITRCLTLICYSAHGPIDNEEAAFEALEILFILGINANMFLLTAISVERCLAVFYPVWYSCNRPKSQSVFVCIFLWGLSILMALVDYLGCPMDMFYKISERCTAVYAFLSVLIFLITIPFMVVSSLILLIRIRKTSKQHHQPKLFIVIVVSVIIFLLSVAPMRLLWLLLYLQVLPSNFSYIAFYSAIYMWASLNSSINPFIYFLVGGEKMHRVKEYIINALKKVFREEEEENGGTSANKAEMTPT